MKDSNIMFDEEMEIEKQKILNMLKEDAKKPEKIIERETKPGFFKLYLNIIKNLFNNKSKKVQKISITQRMRIKLKSWWLNEKTEEVKDLVKFIGIHGFMGMTALMCLLTMTNVNIVLVDIIKRSVLLTALVYMAGTGSMYYLFLDINKVVSSTWSLFYKKKG